MNVTEWKWKTRDGLEIYSKAWEPTGEAKGVVCLVHGMGEHIGKYQVDGEALTEERYILAGFDQRGFGRSSGRRGHTPSLEAYFDDMDSFLSEIGRRYPNLPLFWYGNSMGGVLVLAHAPIRQPKVSGVIATAPGLITALEAQKVKVFLAKLLGKILPTFTFKSGIDPQQFSRDPRIAEEQARDPFAHNLVTAAWGKTMLRAIDLVYTHAPRFPLPVLLMHGTDDQIAYPSGSQKFAQLAPNDKVTVKWWTDFKHELHTDPEKEKVFHTMIEWLDQGGENT